MEVEVTRLIQQYKDVYARVNKIEAQMEYQQKDLQRILEAQASNKVQVEVVIKRLDSMETNILNQLADILRRSTTPDHDHDSQIRWMELFKWVLGGTIIALIAYLWTT